MTLAQLRLIFLAYPGVEEGTSYRTPAFRVGKKLLARMHQSEDAIVLRVASVEEQATLINSSPDTFYITDHYVGHAWVLGNLAAKKDDIVSVFEAAWRSSASKQMIAEFDGD